MDWKQALLVPLYKGKGGAGDTGNSRGISLLSILGKVYAVLLLYRLNQQVDANLHECQNAFKTKGIHDPVVPLGLALIDLRKAYDSINRHMLWEVLRLMGSVVSSGS